MGACYENYMHEFISCFYQPYQEKAVFLCEAIKALYTSEQDPWVEVYPVYRGQVYWNGWGKTVDTDEGFVSEPNHRKLYRDYGVEELPQLDHVTGYLIRHVDQGKVASYGPGDIPKGIPFPEVAKARRESLTNYLNMVRWLVNRDKV